MFMKKIYGKFIFVLSKNFDTSFLGSKYGGWEYIEDSSLREAVIISAGVGTDISFDIEIMQKYNSKIIFVDPTPEALNHLNSVISALGNEKLITYSDDGKQDINSYNLKNLNKENFFVCNKALYTEDNKKIKFYKPKNSQHVSHSISNWQNDYSADTPFIEVKTINFDNLFKKYQISDLFLIKLDIEGAEYKVLKNLLQMKLRVKQILVEFDELQVDKSINYIKYIYLIILLHLKGYSMVRTKSLTNYLFIDKSSFKDNQLS